MAERTALVTGANGFIGRNLRVALGRNPDVRILCFGSDNSADTLEKHLQTADVVYHLAGVNRTTRPEAFDEVNTELTRTLVEMLARLSRTPVIVTSSSTQAVLDNPYGRSKKAGEEIIFEYGARTGVAVHVYRLTNVFGKWSRPNYNSVVATFCHNIAHGLDITISDPQNKVELVYIDDVVDAFLSVMNDCDAPPDGPVSVTPTYIVSLGDLAERLYRLRDAQSSLVIPDLADDFTRKLYTTYLSYLAPDDFAYDLAIHTDQRGALAELIKSEHFGQMFVSRTHGGVLRGNHYHDSKVEKFCVLEGDAVIRFRHIDTDEVVEYHVSGKKWQVVDIPPGYTHHIENLSSGEMIVLFWANEMFDPKAPDTYFREV